MRPKFFIRNQHDCNQEAKDVESNTAGYNRFMEGQKDCLYTKKGYRSLAHKNQEADCWFPYLEVLHS